MNRRVLDILEAVASNRIDRVTRANATWLLAEAQHAKSRRLKKSLGRRKSGQASAAARAQRTAEVRQAVFARANGRCECCGSRTPAELHHLLSGPSRRSRESAETCAAVCAWCHVDLHRNREDAIHRLRTWAAGSGYVEATSALTHRLDKIEEARRPHERTTA